MIVAINEENKRVYAASAKKTDENGDKLKYYCPECHEELILRQGSIKMWHFAHKKNSTCLRNSDNESYEHISMKYVIKNIVERDNNCLKSELEYKIGNRIADYYFEVRDKWNKRRKVAVECVQHHWDYIEFRAKTEYYAKQGVYVIWLFNLNHFSDYLKKEVRINETIKEAHTMYYGKVYAIDINRELVYGVHLDPVVRINKRFRKRYLKRTRIPDPVLIKEFIISSFKRAWDKESLKYLPYRRNVANVWLEKWW